MTGAGSSQVDGPVSVVTGASRGIGAAVAARLGADGHHVVVVYRSEKDAADRTCAAVVAAGGTATPRQTDVASEDEVRELFRFVKHELGSLDVLVNNAGITRDGFTAAMSLNKWASVIDTDLTGSFLCAREAAKIMMAQSFGSIVNVSSIAGLVGTGGQPNYSAAKAGLIGLTKSLADELGGRGIRVNAVVPGFVDTDMLATVPPALLAGSLQRIPLGRAGTAAELAEAVVWLAGPAASYVTGTALVVDGGLTRH